MNHGDLEYHAHNSKNQPTQSDYQFMPGIRGFQISNPPVLETVSLLGSLNVGAQPCEILTLNSIDQFRCFPPPAFKHCAAAQSC